MKKIPHPLPRYLWTTFVFLSAGVAMVHCLTGWVVTCAVAALGAYSLARAEWKPKEHLVVLAAILAGCVAGCVLTHVTGDRSVMRLGQSLWSNVAATSVTLTSLYLIAWLVGVMRSIKEDRRHREARLSRA